MSQDPLRITYMGTNHPTGSRDWFNKMELKLIRPFMNHTSLKYQSHLRILPSRQSDEEILLIAFSGYVQMRTIAFRQRMELLMAFVEMFNEKWREVCSITAFPGIDFFYLTYKEH